MVMWWDQKCAYNRAHNSKLQTRLTHFYTFTPKLSSYLKQLPSETEKRQVVRKERKQGKLGVTSK